MAGPSRLTPFSRFLIAFGIAGGVFYAVKKFLPKKNPVTEKIAPPKTAKSSTILTLSGSNTLSANLIPKMAQQFMSSELGAQEVKMNDLGKNGSEVVGNVQGTSAKIVIKSAGSAQGMNDLLSQKADIALSSSNLEGLSNDLMATVVALDGIAIVVNTANQVKELRKQQIKDIFTGKITDWSQVGGIKGKMVCHTRDATSGTFDAFNNLILDKTPLSNGIQTHTHAAELTKAIASDPNAIGFTSFAELGGTKALGIGDVGTVIRYPSVFTIESEDYLLSRRLYLVAHRNADNKTAQQFLSYAQADDKGQKIVESAGFVSMDLHKAAQYTSIKTTDAPPLYVTATSGASRLPTSLHFQTASATPDERALADLERVKKLVTEPQNRSKQLLLIGFTDNAGDPKKNQALSVQRAQSIQSELSKAGIKANVTGFGPAMPIANNAIPAGKDKNRRVEVWIK